MADIFEQRQTPSILGLGLIDTISDAEVLSHEDPNDNNGDGCRGTAHMIDIAGVLEVGKFGWKAQVPKLSDFLRDASTGEVGLTLVERAAQADWLAAPEAFLGWLASWMALTIDQD